MKRKYVILMLALGALAGGLYLRHTFSMEQRLKRSLHRAAHNFEKERLLGAIGPLHKGYSDDYGMTFEMLAGQVKSVMNDYDALMLHLDVLSVSVREDEATTGIRFYLTGSIDGERNHLLGNPAEPCTAVLVWARTPRGFLIVTTRDLDIPGRREELRKRLSESARP